MNKQTLYVGAYTTSPPAAGERAEGLFVYQMDTATGHLERTQAMDAGENPSFMALSRDSDRLYVASETGEGSVSAFAIEPLSGQLRLLNRQPVMGDDPCHLSLGPEGKTLLAACYSSGSLTVFSMQKDGSLGNPVQRIQHTGSGPNIERQEKAHVHCAMTDPGEKFILVVDLGMDRVWIYPVDPTSGLPNTAHAGGSQAAQGAGPRHLAFHPNEHTLYISNELNSTVTACRWNGTNGNLTEIQTLSTLPEDFVGENTAADIHITPDGRTLYVSNRGHDSLAAYHLEQESGKMRLVGYFSSGGRGPRNFAIDPTGQFVLVANQYSGNVVVQRILADGALALTGEEASILAPVCVVFENSA